ncbi:MAG TPA: BTAD domain-containing putative transcriptional regulator [Gaiellaceae bacterium]
MSATRGGGGLEVRLLGPLQVLRDGRPVLLGGARQRAVLAVLVLHANEVVGTERLVDAVWGDEAPLTAAKIVHNNVSQLRKLLEPDVASGGGGSYELLVRHRAGYELRIEPERVDALRFAHLVQEGRQALAAEDPAAASARLREALALWRGPTLAEFVDAPFADRERSRLEELRLAALEDRVDADLAGGRSAELVGELEALVALHPLRERLRTQLMLALYRAGRQAEALGVFQAARNLLVDEFGIDPGPALQRLQRAILLQDPALELAPAAADEQREPPVPRVREVRKTVSVVITELVPLGPPLDPEVLHEPLVQTLDEISRALERHGGAVDRAVGGAVVAVFGIPAVHEDDPLRAVRAAIDAREAVAAASGLLERELGVRLALRAAVTTGGVLADAASVGSAGLAGAAIDAALRLQAEAGPNEILVADATRRLLPDRLRAEPVGRAKPNVWRLDDVLPAAPVGSRDREPPLVGRERELGALAQALSRTLRDQTPYLFTVLGAAGIGKSRIAGEFVSAHGGRAMVLHGRCPSYGDGIALWPIAEMVEQLCGGDELAALLAGEPEGGMIVERITAATGPGAPTTSTDDTFWAVSKLFGTLARRRPLVLVLDDLHWAEPTLLDLVEHVVDRNRDVPIFVVCLARPELLETRDAWGGGKLNATSILLGPLSERESHALIGHLASGTTIAPGLLDRVAAVAEGNPLFLEQMVAMLRERGPSAELAVPPTIHALLEARLDRLPAGEREVLERASVVGKEFWRDAVVELAPAEVAADVDEHLDALLRRDLIRPARPLLAGEDGFEFRHVLLREAAYDSLPKRLRAELHERFALWLEQSPAMRVAELDEILGYHYEAAHRHHGELRLGGPGAVELAARAAERLTSGGRRAYARDDLPAAVSLLARAAAVCDGGAAGRLELLVDLGDALRETGELERATSVLAEAAETAGRGGDPSDRAYVEIARLRLQLQADREVEIDAVSDEARRAIAVFEERREDRRLAKAWELLAWVPWFQCQAAQADAALQQAVTCARRAGDGRTEAQSLHLSIGAMLFGPTPIDAAARRCEEILARPCTQPRLRASALRALAGLAAWAGDDARARVLVRSHRALVEDLGLRVAGASAAETYGIVELAAGDPVAAEAEFRRGYDSLDEMRERTLSSLLAALLADALHAQGRDDEALEFSERSRDAAGADDLLAQVQWRTARAKPLARAGRGAEAETLAREAMALVRTTDFLAARGDAAFDLAEVLRLDGRGAEALPYVEEALALYEEKGCRSAALRSRTALAELSVTPQPL